MKIRVTAEADAVPLKMILPPDGRQTRLELFRENPTKKQGPEWWQSISSWFKNDHKTYDPKLEFYAQQVARVKDVQAVEAFVVYKSYGLKIPYIL